MGRVHASTSKTNSALGGLVRQLGAVALAYKGLSVVKGAIRDFADFERQIAMVSTMLDKQTMSFLPKYRDEIGRLAVSYGQSTETLSKGLYDILSASIPAGQALEVLGVSARAGVGGMSDTATAADAVTTILNSYGLEAEYAAKVSSDLFETVKLGKTTFGELAPNIGKVASLAASAGVSLEEMLNTLATMTRAGMRSEVAITGLRAILNGFASPQQDAVQYALDEFGITLNTTGLHADQLSGVLEKLKGATMDQLAAVFPNIRAAVGFAAALNQVEKNAEGVAYILQTEGEDLNAFNKMADTAATATDRWAAAAETLSRSLGEALAPALTEATNNMSQFVQDNQTLIGEWARDMTDGVDFAIELQKVYSDLALAPGKMLLGAGQTKAKNRFQTQFKHLSEADKASFQQAYESQTGDKVGFHQVEAAYGPGQMPRTERQFVYPSNMDYANKLLSKYLETDETVDPLVDLRRRLKKMAEQKVLEAKGPASVQTGRPTYGPNFTEGPSALDMMKVSLDRFGKDDHVADLAQQMKGLYAVFDGGYTSIKKSSDITATYVDDLEFERQALGMNADELEKATLIRQAEQEALAEGTRLYHLNSQAISRSIDLLQEERRIRDAQEISDRYLDDMQFQYDLLLMTNREQEKAIFLDRARQEAKHRGTSLNPEQEEALAEQYDRVERLSRIEDYADSFGNAWGRAFTDFATGARTASEAVKALAADIARMTVQKAVADPLSTFFAQGAKNLLSSAIGAWGSGSGGGASGGYTVDGGNPVTGEGFHTGGTVGRPGQPTRVDHLANWHGAPRLHTGLKTGLGADEYRVILKEGERVYAANDTSDQAALNVAVNVKNEMGREATISTKTRRVDLENAVVDVLIKQKRRRSAGARGLGL